MGNGGGKIKDLEQTTSAARQTPEDPTAQSERLAQLLKLLEPLVEEKKTVQVLDVAERYLKSKDLRYHRTDDKIVFFHHCAWDEDAPHRVVIGTLSDGHTFQISTQYGFWKHDHDAIVEWVTRANFGLRHGKFNFDERDGEVTLEGMVKLTQMSESAVADVVNLCIPIIIATFNRYLPGAENMFRTRGGCGAKAAIAQCEGGSSGDSGGESGQLAELMRLLEELRDRSADPEQVAAEDRRARSTSVVDKKKLAPIGAPIPSDHPRSEPTPASPNSPVVVTPKAGDLPVIAPAALEIKTLLGEGGFKKVFLGRWQGGSVAVGQLKVTVPEKELQDFHHELSLLASFRHPNLVLLMGVCVEAPLAIVTEFCSKGSLYDCLHKKKSLSPLEPKGKSPLELEKRAVSMMFDIACGLNYLHKQRIAHRDLKSLNVLVGRGDQLKICDFGCSKLRTQSSTMHTVVGSPLWMAPEIMRNETYSYPADVYSMGLVFYEICTGTLPYEGLNQMQLCMEVAMKGTRPTFPGEGAGVCSKNIRDIIQQCWGKPDERPLMDVVVESLHEEGARLGLDF